MCLIGNKSSVKFIQVCASNVAPGEVKCFIYSLLRLVHYGKILGWLVWTKTGGMGIQKKQVCFKWRGWISALVCFVLQQKEKEEEERKAQAEEEEKEKEKKDAAQKKEVSVTFLPVPACYVYCLCEYFIAVHTKDSRRGLQWLIHWSHIELSSEQR